MAGGIALWRPAWAVQVICLQQLGALHGR